MLARQLDHLRDVQRAPPGYAVFQVEVEFVSMCDRAGRDPIAGAVDRVDLQDDA